MLHRTISVNMFSLAQGFYVDYDFNSDFAFQLDQTGHIEHGEPLVPGIRRLDLTEVLGRHIRPVVRTNEILPLFDIVRFLFEQIRGEAMSLARQNAEKLLSPCRFDECAVCNDGSKNYFFDVQPGRWGCFFDELLAIDEILVQSVLQKPFVSKLVAWVLAEGARNVAIPIATVISDDDEMDDVFGHQPLILYCTFIMMTAWRGVLVMLMHLGYIFLWWFIAGIFGLLNEITLVLIVIAYVVYRNSHRRGNSFASRAAGFFKRRPPKGYMSIEDHNEIVVRMTETIQDLLRKYQKSCQNYEAIANQAARTIKKIDTELVDLRHEIVQERNNVRLEKIRCAEVEKKLDNALATATYGLLYVYLHNRERFEEMVYDFKAKQQEQEPSASDADETFENKTWWEILGVSKDASRLEINTAFRNLSHKYHPDVSDHPDAEELFKRLSGAREEGLKQAKRAA